MIYKDFIYRNKLPLMNRALDAYALRQKVIAKNIANATTENYVPQEVKFEQFFQEAKISAIGTLSDEQHIPIGNKGPAEITAEIKPEEIAKGDEYFAGESHVNVDKEMSELAQNQLRFRFASRMVKRYFSGLNTAITGFRE